MLLSLSPCAFLVLSISVSRYTLITFKWKYIKMIKQSREKKHGNNKSEKTTYNNRHTHRLDSIHAYSILFKLISIYSINNLSHCSCIKLLFFRIRYSLAGWPSAPLIRSHALPESTAISAFWHSTLSRFTNIIVEIVWVFNVLTATTRYTFLATFYSTTGGSTKAI